MNFTDLFNFFSLSDPNIRYVLAGIVLIGLSSSIVGCFAFLRKKSLIGDAVSHSVLPGIALAFMLFNTKNLAVLLLGAFSTGWLSLVLIDYFSSNSKLKADTTTALVLSLFFGIGTMLITSIQNTAGARQAGLDRFLFGKAASIMRSDLLVYLVSALLIIGFTLLLFRQFKLISFDRDFAASVGIKPQVYEMILSWLTVLSVVIGIQAVGVVLMAAMLITPAAAARFWTDKLKLMISLAVLFSVLGGIVGAFISYTLPAMPTGPWVIVTLSVIAFISMLIAPQKGYFFRIWRQKKNREKIRDENILKIFYHLGESDQHLSRERTIEELISRRDMGKEAVKKGLSSLLRKGQIEKAGHGWKLLAAGAKEAKRIVRLHRLWEIYLTQYLSLPPDHVHDDAEAMEHVIDEQTGQRLEEILLFPNKDPHNKHIPYENPKS